MNKTTTTNNAARRPPPVRRRSASLRRRRRSPSRRRSGIPATAPFFSSSFDQSALLLATFVKGVAPPDEILAPPLLMPTASCFNAQTLKWTIDNNVEDRISQLPDGILIDILSRLTIKEAGRGSVLSHRWRNLWKLSTCLNFDASKLGIQRSKFVSWVNEVLRLHESPSVDEFTVKSDFSITPSDAVDNWIRFTVPKKVKTLEINLFSFATSEAHNLSQDCYDYLRSSFNLSSILCLRSLTLDTINVDEGLFEYFLSNCSNLARLSVSYSTNPINLKVTSPSLQYLNICGCHLSSIELCAPKLVTFEYFGKKTIFLIGDNPRLVNLSLGGGTRHEVACYVVPFSNCLPQLETLEMKMQIEGFLHIKFPPVPQMENLKHLIVDVGVRGGLSLLGFATLVGAAPSLEKFTFQLLPIFSNDVESDEPLIQPPHRQLKVVELLGFYGNSNELELVKCLLESATNLEKIVIDLDPRYRPEIDKRGWKKIRKGVAKLRGSLPLGAKLIISYFNEPFR